MLELDSHVTDVGHASTHGREVREIGTWGDKTGNGDGSEPVMRPKERRCPGNTSSHESILAAS
jgi:hypothetical protein